LFQSNKRTCSLSHIRLGASKSNSNAPAGVGVGGGGGDAFDFKVFRCPEDASLEHIEYWLEMNRAVYEDCLYAVTAVPEVSKVSS
jgi:hypothetical protein